MMRDVGALPRVEGAVHVVRVAVAGRNDMSETPQAGVTSSQVPGQTRGQERVTPDAAPEGLTEGPAEGLAEGPPTAKASSAWAGWVFFAALVMILVGAFQAIIGLTALFEDGYFVVRRNGLLVSVDYTTWGWVHLALGVVALAAGFGLLAGKLWARILGVALAGLSALVNLAFLAAYPVWAIVVITLDVVAIYAIAVHGTAVAEEE